MATLFDDALQHHQGGRLEEAERLYRAVLLLDPEEANALHLLGAVTYQRGRPEEAVELIERAISYNDQIAAFHDHLGSALQALGRLEEAAAAYEHALALAPGYAEGYSNLGVVRKAQGRLVEAVDCYRRALTLKPDYAEGHVNLGAVLQAQGEHAQAVVCYRKAILLQPSFAEAYSNLGVALHQLKDFAEARSCFGHAVALRPDYADAHYNLGNLLRDMVELEQAAEAYRRALAAKPGYAEAQSNLATTLVELGSLDAAAPAYARTFALAPDGIGLDAAVYLALLHYLRGDLTETGRLLRLCQPITERTEERHQSARIYWHYLERLHCLQPAPDHTDAPQLMPLHVIGESHSLAVHRVVVSQAGRLLLGVAHWINGCKQWHLANSDANRYKKQFRSIVERLPPGSTMLLMIGEIDCRPDDGILAAWRKSADRPLEAIIHDTVEGYLSHIAAATRPYGHQPIVAGVPAPNLPGGAPSDAAELVALIRSFNARLARSAARLGFGFLDLYALTDAGRGIASGHWHLDRFHLRPAAFTEAFRRHYLPGRATQGLGTLPDEPGLGQDGEAR